jgi:hypothetical protein
MTLPAITDRNVQYPNRIHLDEVSAGTYDVTAVPGNVVAAGTPINAALFAALGAWETWTPSFYNLAVGTGGTVTARKTKIGQLMVCTIDAIFGSSGFGVYAPVRVSLPATAAAGAPMLSTVSITDQGTTTYVASGLFYDTNNLALFIPNVAGTYPSVVNLSATVPMTWAAGDRLRIACMYETAT